MFKNTYKYIDYDGLQVNCKTNELGRIKAQIDKEGNKTTFNYDDRGNEFKNKSIDGLLSTFKIERSLSKKGCPYDNAVEEATFKVIKRNLLLIESLSCIKV